MASGIVSLCLTVAAVGILWTGTATLAHGQNGDARAVLLRSLNQTFAATTVSADRNEIVTAGAVLILQKDGMMMYSVAAPLPPANTYKSGRISQGWRGFGKDIGISMLTPGGATASSYPQRKLPAGEKIWVNQIAVEKDGISFVLYSDPYNNIRYYGELKIPFAKGSIPAPDEALRTIAEVLTMQPPDNSASSGSQQQAPAAPALPVQAPPDQPLPAIAPPPPPADAAPPPPPTISLGDTKDQVVAALGQPQKVVQLGTKEIDYYPDMKVTFIKGKVTDVQ
jgi:hypothetical protein